MNIVHIAPNSTYTEGFGYQENLLTKYQARLGHAVTLIVPDRAFVNGRSCRTELEDYMSPDGFRVIRRKTVSPFRPLIGDGLLNMDLYQLLAELKPDMVFYHGFVSFCINQVVRYKRKVNPKLLIVQDNHLDYNNGMQFGISWKQSVRCWMYRLLFKKNQRYIRMMYAVTPWRRQYAQEILKIPEKQTDLLMMGADDEKLQLENRAAVKKRIKEEWKIDENTFLIVTGGKLDAAKNILPLMEACSALPDVTLLLFGSVAEEIRERFDGLLAKSGRLVYIGWIDGDKVYDYFMTADLCFFPGGHSVLWEQACASKTPCVFKFFEGMDHVNNGGNAEFLYEQDEDSIRRCIQQLCFTQKYYEMKRAAESSKTDIYLYSKIAEKSLEYLQ